LNIDVVTRGWIESDGPKADIADIIVRSMSHNKPTPPSRPVQETGDVLRQMMDAHPAFEMLVNKFDLIEEHGK
jgi:hypothetical protein